MTPEEMLITDISMYSRDPLGYCLYAFPWGEDGDLSDSPGPRKWQADILRTISHHLVGPDRHAPLQIAVSSGHGIGKSALIGMICSWAMSTCDDCRIVVTANTEAQLATKTWPEIGKWFGRSINAHWWSPTATKIASTEKGHENSWRMDRETWSENNTEAFAGLHNVGKRIVVIYDEASSIPSKIWEVTEGALTDENTEIIWLAFGNPTQNTGRFKECFGVYKHRWVRRQIDSRTVEGTNKTQIQQWIEDYGEDSDFCRVRIRGEFPRAGTSQFIPGDLVNAARKRDARNYQQNWKIISVDVARFGDDQTVIGMRQGPKFTILDRVRGLSTPQTAMRVMAAITEHNPRGVIIDGDGVGGGVVDYVNLHHAEWIAAHPMCRFVEFHGGMPANDNFMYYNRRAEVWGAAKEWLKDADIPDDPEIETDLTAPEYSFSSKNQIQLEKKDDMKKRGLASPDNGDTIAMSFAAYTPGKSQEERDQERVAAAPDQRSKFLLQYRLTQERDQREARSEERPPENWE
jgi:hypothetical protein